MTVKLRQKGLAFLDHINTLKDRRDKAIKLMEILGLDVRMNGYIDVVELYDTITDDKKCKTLIVKLKNKALW